MIFSVAFENEFDYRDYSNSDTAINVAVALFIGYVDAATSIRESHGGGGSSSDKGWGATPKKTMNVLVVAPRSLRNTSNCNRVTEPLNDNIMPKFTPPLFSDNSTSHVETKTENLEAIESLKKATAEFNAAANRLDAARQEIAEMERSLKSAIQSFRLTVNSIPKKVGLIMPDATVNQFNNTIAAFEKRICEAHNSTVRAINDTNKHLHAAADNAGNQINRAIDDNVHRQVEYLKDHEGHFTIPQWVGINLIIIFIGLITFAAITIYNNIETWHYPPLTTIINYVMLPFGVLLAILDLILLYCYINR